jgi:alkaline phosphatase D
MDRLRLKPSALAQPLGGTAGRRAEIVAERTGQPTVILRLGCLDTPITDRAKAHIWRNVLAQGQLVAQLRQRGQDGVVGHWTEGWDGYPAGRRRMLDGIAATRLSNPVFIGGDIHSFWATDLKADFSNPSSATIATEFVGTSVTSGGPPYELLAQALPDNLHVHFFESRHRGYVSVDVRPDRMETRFQVISDRRDPNATLSTLKRFVVESGKPGAVPA